MDLHRTHCPYYDLVGHGMASVATRTPTAGQAMMSVGLHLSPAYALMGSNKWGSEAKTNPYPKFVFAEEQSKVFACEGLQSRTRTRTRGQ